MDERLKYVSAMRVMAMMMIVAFHSMLFYTGKWWVFGGPVIPLWVKVSSFLDAIDLPMFVFIAGFLFGHLYKFKGKYRDKRQFVIGKARRLLVPYLVWGLFLVYVLPPYNHLADMLTGISHLWFLLMLFDVFLIAIASAHVLFREGPAFQWAIFFVGSILLFCAFHIFSTHHHFLCLHSALYHLPAFVLGVGFACLRLHSRITAKTASVVLVVALVCQSAYLFLCPVQTYFADYAILLMTGYAIVASSFVLLGRTADFGPKASAIISHFDKLSMGIYIFNQIVINAFLGIPGTIPFLSEHYYVGVPIVFVVSFAVPWLLSWLFNRFRCLKWLIG